MIFRIICLLFIISCVFWNLWLVDNEASRNYSWWAWNYMGRSAWRICFFEWSLIKLVLNEEFKSAANSRAYNRWDFQGVKAVIAKSFERIHRSNLVGMGIIPLCFKSLTGHERYTINLPTDISEIRPGQDVTVTTDNGKSFTCTVRFDTEVELAYFNHGGILPYVIRNLSKQ